MQRTLTHVSIGAVVVALAAVLATSALATSSHRGPRSGPGMFGAAGPGGPGFFGGHGLRPRAAGAGGLAGADVLTPAAGYLGSSASDLANDLKSGKTLAQEATAKGKTASGLIDAIVAAEKKVFDAEVSAGWLTDTQETNVLARVKQAVTDLVNNGPVAPLAPRNGPLQTAAAYLGISVGDLQGDLRSGKSLADEANANGKSVDGLVQALVAPLKSALDKRVSSGNLTSAQETGILDRAQQRLTNLVNDKKPASMQAGLRNAGLRLALQRLFVFHR
jgi:hypothetical protein